MKKGVSSTKNGWCIFLRSDPSKCVFSQGAVNLTSKLFEDVSEIQNGDLKTNILVSCEKLEKFLMHYASLHMTSQNDSETELSIEQQELGKVFKKAFRLGLLSYCYKTNLII